MKRLLLPIIASLLILITPIHSLADSSTCEVSVSVVVGNNDNDEEKTEKTDKDTTEDDNQNKEVPIKIEAQKPQQKKEDDKKEPQNDIQISHNERDIPAGNTDSTSDHTEKPEETHVEEKVALDENLTDSPDVGEVITIPDEKAPKLASLEDVAKKIIWIFKKDTYPTYKDVPKEAANIVICWLFISLILLIAVLILLILRVRRKNRG